MTAVMMGGDGWDSADLDVKAADGGFYSNHYDPGDTRPIVQDWLKTYGDEYKDDKGQPKVPDALATLAYDAANLLIAAIEKAGADDTTKVAEALAAITWEGVSGKITFDAQHNPIKAAAVIGVAGRQEDLRRVCRSVNRYMYEGAVCQAAPFLLHPQVHPRPEVLHECLRKHKRILSLRQIIRKRLLGKAFLIVVAAAGCLEAGCLFPCWANRSLSSKSSMVLQLGFVYALIALGYTMVYGIVRLINFAHGDVFMVGAFVSYYAIARLGLEHLAGQLIPGLPDWLSTAHRCDHWLSCSRWSPAPCWPSPSNASPTNPCVMHRVFPP